MTTATKRHSLLLAYLQLLRIPNVFTAVADVTMGFLFVGSSLAGQLPAYLTIVLASCCLYLAGMVLNDVFDFDVDLRERPQRPLPSGRISKSVAIGLGVGLLVAGVAAGWSVGLFDAAGGMTGIRPGIIAAGLAVMVMLYDGVVKKTFLAPLAMGSCRLLNVLLGMSVDARFTSRFGFSADQWLVAGGLGVYIAGVTWFARHEAQTSRRSSLISATAVIFAGIVMLALFPFVRDAPATRFTHDAVWPLLLAIVMFPVFRRCLVAIGSRQPAQVQAAVKRAILALIVLDAAICLATVGTPSALLVVSLLAPTLVLGRWVYST